MEGIEAESKASACTGLDVEAYGTHFRLPDDIARI